MGREIKVVGRTDEVTTCDCCGKQNLKFTVMISVDGAEPGYYGCVCAVKVFHGRFTDTKQVKVEMDAVERVKWALDQCHDSALTDDWLSWLSRNAKSGTLVFEQYRSLGGLEAARSMWRASMGF